MNLSGMFQSQLPRILLTKVSEHILNVYFITLEKNESLLFLSFSRSKSGGQFTFLCRRSYLYSKTFIEEGIRESRTV